MSDEDDKRRAIKIAERELRLAASMRPARKARNKARYTRKRKHRENDGDDGEQQR